MFVCGFRFGNFRSRLFRGPATSTGNSEVARIDLLFVMITRKSKRFVKIVALKYGTRELRIEKVRLEQVQSEKMIGSSQMTLHSEIKFKRISRNVNLVVYYVIYNKITSQRTYKKYKNRNQYIIHINIYRKYASNEHTRA